MERKLAAILAADVVGFSRLMEIDEVGTLISMKQCRSEVIDRSIVEYRGHIVKLTGDGMLVEFHSIIDAVACAVVVQRSMAARNEGLPQDRRIEFRIGVNLGDVIVEGDDIFGDGVNIASRLESISPTGGIAVSAAVRDLVGNRLDVHFHDTGQQTLKNIARPVRVFVVQADATPAVAMTGSEPGLVLLPEKPSIAVLPFVNLSHDPEQEYFADGMVEELITALSRMRWLFVIARNSSFVYKNRSVDVKQVGRELGVRYVLEGSVRRSGERVRITGQLIDTTNGNHIWANRYEGRLADVFDLQDRIAESVVGAIQPMILSAEIARSARKRPDSLAAYDFVLRALPLVWSLSRSDSEKAQALLEKALSIEPTYALALSLAAWCHAQRVVYNWTDSIAEERSTALQLAQRAASISREDPMVLAILGAAHTIVRDFRIAAEHLERALELDPNSAWAWNRSGWLNVHRSQGELAIEQFERAIRLSPFDPAAFVALFGIADAHFLQGRYEEAIEWSHKGLSQQPNALWQLRVLVPALIHTRRLEEAKQCFAAMMKHYPGLTITKVRDALPFAPEMTDRIVAGLREAGLPE